MRARFFQRSNETRAWPSVRGLQPRIYIYVYRGTRVSSSEINCSQRSFPVNASCRRFTLFYIFFQNDDLSTKKGVKLNGRTVSLNPLDSVVCSSRTKSNPRTETNIYRNIDELFRNKNEKSRRTVSITFFTGRCNTTSDSRVRRNCIHRTDCITIGPERWSCSKRLAVISRDTREISAGEFQQE